MTALEVISAGIATSVQDGGRFGAQRYGLAPSGAMDRLSLAAANVLAGNAPLAAAIEIGPAAVTFIAKGGSLLIAVTGALRQMKTGDTVRPLYRSVVLSDGESLSLGAAREGVFSYLAIQGGIAGQPVFGSLSVNARAGVGSPLPRPLRSGDSLDIAPSARSPLTPASIAPPVFHSGAFRVVMGPQDDQFGAACDTLLNSEWRISANSDRMGYRLEGPSLSHDTGHNIVSDGTVDGSIQVSGNGQPIVLMRDRGTTGGYPKIATIISSDLGRFAQTPPRRPIRFEAVTVDEAQTQARLFHELLESLPHKGRDVKGE
jgi:biotin-dependent carboxylase-like uncharacterized protein